MLLAGLLLAGAAAGQPVYLKCTFPPNTDIVVDITADEANSAVTVSLSSTGYTGKMAAAFTADEVRFQDNTISYVLSRTDLTIRRTVKLLSETTTGTCKVQAATKRAF